MTKSAQRHFLVTVSGVGGTFQTFTGGRRSSEVTKEYDGGSIDPDVLTGPPDIENVTVGRAYDPPRDDAIIRRLRERVGRFEATINVQPLDRDMVRTGRPTSYTGILIGLTAPEVNSGSGDTARFELEFAISR
jgi:hypothetical protein